MDVLEGLGVVDGEDTEEALSCPHVLVPHGAVLLLTCSVQDVQQARLSVNHHLLPVRVLDGGGRDFLWLEHQCTDTTSTT